MWEKEVFARGRVDNGALLKFWGVNNRDLGVGCLACDQPDFAWRLAWLRRQPGAGRGSAGVTYQTRYRMTNTHVIVAPGTIVGRYY